VKLRYVGEGEGNEGALGWKDERKRQKRTYIPNLGQRH
jgi:hypothetical protein